jgi:hypothetical protein
MPAAEHRSRTAGEGDKPQDSRARHRGVGQRQGTDDVMLSPKLLEELRAHWRCLHRQPNTWLFPGNRHHSGDGPIDTKTIPDASTMNVGAEFVDVRVFAEHLLNNKLQIIASSATEKLATRTKKQKNEKSG